MSHESNTNLLEEARFYAEYWEGTLYAKLIRWYVEIKDWDALYKIVKEAKDEAFNQEYQPTEDIRTF